MVLGYPYAFEELVIVDLAAEQRVRNRRGRPSETLRLATAQEIGHSGSLGSNAGGHAPSRALGLSRTRKTMLAALLRGS